MMVRLERMVSPACGKLVQIAPGWRVTRSAAVRRVGAFDGSGWTELYGCAYLAPE